MTDGFELTKIQPVIDNAVTAKPNFVSIETQEQAEETNQYLELVEGTLKKIDEFCDPEIQQAHALHKNLIAKKKQLIASLVEVKGTFRNMLTDYQVRKRREAEAEQRRLDEEARKQALKEAEKNGDEKTAKAIESGKVAVVSEKAVAPPPKLNGVSLRVTWKAEVTDLKALAKAVGSGKVPITYVQPNQSALDGIMRSTKGQMQIPGVVARKQSSTVKR